MQTPPDARTSRKRRVLIALLGFLTAALLLVVALVAVAAFTVYQAGKILANQVMVSMIEGLAVWASIVVTLAALMLVVLLVMTLQTPFFLAPFGPAAEIIRFGVRLWLGHD